MGKKQESGQKKRIAAKKEVTVAVPEQFQPFMTPIDQLTEHPHKEPCESGAAVRRSPWRRRSGSSGTQPTPARGHDGAAGSRSDDRRDDAPTASLPGSSAGCVRQFDRHPMI